MFSWEQTPDPNENIDNVFSLLCWANAVFTAAPFRSTSFPLMLIRDVSNLYSCHQMDLELWNSMGERTEKHVTGKLFSLTWWMFFLETKSHEDLHQMLPCFYTAQDVNYVL